MSASKASRARSMRSRARMPLQAADERAGDRADHLQRDGGRNRRWRYLLQRPRLRRLAGARSQANLYGRPHGPRQDIEAWQSLPARLVRSGGVGCAGQNWERHGLKPWLEAARKRLHPNVLAIALANKLARIAWSVLAHGRTFAVGTIAEATAQTF